MIPNSMNSGIIIFFIELLTIAFFLVRFEIEFQILILRKTKNQRGGGDMTELNYQTKQRTVILNFLTANAGETYDVDSLYDTLVKRGEKVSRTTVYRMLKKLEEEKSIVSFFDASRKRTLFRFNPNPDAGENQIHLQCTACGKVEHLDCSYLSSFEAHLQTEHHFKLSASKRVFSGICEDCERN